MKVLYIGRFQPLHKGHLSVIEWLFDKYGKENVTIAIGSSDKSHEFKNPFTFEERAEMIRASIKDIDGIEGIPDYETDGKWVEETRKRTRFDAICSGSNWVQELFEKEGVEVIKPKFYKQNNRIVSASLVREKIAKGQKWEQLVTKQTAEILKRIKGIERIRSLAEKERKEWFYKKQIGN